MTAPPEDRIREHLERRDEATTVDLRRLLGTWGFTEGTAAERDHVAQALAGAGIDARPALATASLETTIALTLAVVPQPSVVTRAPARARHPVESEASSADEEPVVIPPALPRALLTFGAVGLVASLFLPWFAGSAGGIAVPDLSTGWQWLSVLDVYLVVVAVAAGILLVTDALGELGPRAVAALAMLGLAGVTYRIVAPPDHRVTNFVIEVALKVGPFVALIALALVIAGAGLQVTSPDREATVLPDGQAAGPSRA